MRRKGIMPNTHRVLIGTNGRTRLFMVMRRMGARQRTTFEQRMKAAFVPPHS